MQDVAPRTSSRACCGGFGAVVVESASHLGSDNRPALGGVPAFFIHFWGLVAPTASPIRDLFQLLSKPISRNDELRLHLLECELQSVSIGRVMP